MTIGHLSPVWRMNEDFWPTLSLGPSRGRCRAVSTGHKDADSVDALIETYSPRATQIGRATHKVLLFMTYFNTTLPMIREICACLLTTKARTGNSQA